MSPYPVPGNSIHLHIPNQEKGMDPCIPNEEMGCTPLCQTRKAHASSYPTQGKETHARIPNKGIGFIPIPQTRKMAYPIPGCIQISQTRKRDASSFPQSREEMNPHIPYQERACIPMPQARMHLRIPKAPSWKAGNLTLEGHASPSTASLPPLGTLILSAIFSIPLPEARVAGFSLQPWIPQSEAHSRRARPPACRRGWARRSPAWPGR